MIGLHTLRKRLPSICQNTPADSDATDWNAGRKNDIFVMRGKCTESDDTEA